MSGWPGSKQAAGGAPSAAAIPHSREGAQSAAAEMAAAYGSEQMFNPAARHHLLQATVDPDQQAKLIQDTDDQYGPFTRRLGLDEQGHPPAGAKFVSRVMPAGTRVRSYTGSTADVDVWCSTLFGLTGKNVPTQIPVESGWLTMSMSLRWTDTGWKVTHYQQTDGPEPTDKTADFGKVPKL